MRFLAFGNGTLSALYDRSIGFFRRQIILTTKDREPNRIDDPYLSEKLIAEKRVSSCGVWKDCIASSTTTFNSPSANRRRPISRAQFKKVTALWSFWSQKATSGSKPTASLHLPACMLPIDSGATKTQQHRYT